MHRTIRTETINILVFGTTKNQVGITAYFHLCQSHRILFDRVSRLRTVEHEPKRRKHHSFVCRRAPTQAAETLCFCETLVWPAQLAAQPHLVIIVCTPPWYSPFGTPIPSFHLSKEENYSWKITTNEHSGFLLFSNHIHCLFEVAKSLC